MAVGVLVSLFGVGSLTGAGQATSTPSRNEFVPISATFHIVEPGDTLWALARRAQPDGDIRPLVARLRAEHGPGPLVPGERLRIAV